MQRIRPVGRGFFELPVDAESLQRRIQGEIRSWASLAPRSRFIGEPRSTFPEYASASTGSMSHSGRPNQVLI